MLNIRELRKYAFKRGLKVLDHIRKDYIQDLTLFILYSRIFPKFIFKGGTCLWKLYKSFRFSEDIDLQVDRKMVFDRELVHELELWGFDVEVQKKRYTQNSLFMRLMLRGADFGSTQISIEMTFRKGIGEERILYSPYPDIPDFEVYSQPLEIMLQDKVNALMTRSKPRDLFDIYFIITRYNLQIKCDPQLLERRIDMLKSQWESLRAIVMRRLPNFNEVKRVVIKNTIFE